MPRPKKDKEPNDYFTWEEEKKPKRKLQRHVIDLETNSFSLDREKIIDILFFDEATIVEKFAKKAQFYQEMYGGTKSGRISSKGPNMQTLLKRK